jgi:hypothetical protein
LSQPDVLKQHFSTWAVSRILLEALGQKVSKAVRTMVGDGWHLIVDNSEEYCISMSIIISHSIRKPNTCHAVMNVRVRRLASKQFDDGTAKRPNI